jgi:hypothetical protein
VEFAIATAEQTVWICGALVCAMVRCNAPAVHPPVFVSPPNVGLFRSRPQAPPHKDHLHKTLRLREPRTVPVTVPGGVYVIPPAVVRDVGHGSLKPGEKVLDLFVRKVRDEAGRKMLPPPPASLHYIMTKPADCCPGILPRGFCFLPMQMRVT